LLEKERAVVGSANFGHAPHNEDNIGWNKVIPDLSEPNKMHQALVVNVLQTQEDSYNETVRQHNNR